MPDSTLTYDTLMDMIKQLEAHNRPDQVVVVLDANSDPPGKMYIFEMSVAVDLVTFFGIVPLDGLFYICERKNIPLLKSEEVRRIVGHQRTT